MKLYWIVLVLTASMAAQRSTLFVGPAGDPHDAAVSLNFQNPANQFGTAGAGFGSQHVDLFQTEAGPGAAKLDGIVKSRVPPRGPVPNALVKLFPDPPNPQRPDLVRSTRTDDWGNFVIENVIPGKYRAIAIMGAGPEDPEAEATIAAHAGTSVELPEKKSKTLVLYLYAAAH